MPEGFEYFPYSFKAWKSPPNPSKQEGFSQYCVWYLYVAWIAHSLFGLLHVSPSLQIIPESGTPVAVAFRGTVTNRKVLAGTLAAMCAVLPGHSLCLQWALLAQDSANPHGNNAEEGNGTRILGCGTYYAHSISCWRGSPFLLVAPDLPRRHSSLTELTSLPELKQRSHDIHVQDGQP